ncbi:MAG: interleukin-like EMT inducer domain-containing protein [Anaerolineae bacterium]
MMRPSAMWRTHLIVLLVYTLLAVLLTWPTVTHAATHLPGDGGDDPAIAWNLWWVKYALLDLRTNPLFSDFMFYPLGVNLAFYTLTTLNALTAMPLTLTLGVVAASNLHLGLGMVVGGYGAFLLARHLLATSWQGVTGWSVSVWPAALAGGFYAFASSQLFYISLGQFNIASSHWLPYTIIFIFKSRRDLPSLKWPVMAALFLTMQAWAEMTYASFLIVFIALYVVYEGIKGLYAPRLTLYAPRSTLYALRNLLLLAFLFTLGISPLLAAMLPDMRAEGDFWVRGSGFAEVFSADLLGFLVPTMRHPFFGDLVSRTGIVDYDKGQHIYLGFTLLVLAVTGTIAGVRSRRLRWQTCFWLVAAILFAWLTLGPSLHINGQDTGLPGPFILLQSLPFFKGNRYPSRYSVLLVLSLAMLAAHGVDIITHAVREREGGPGHKWGEVGRSRGVVWLGPVLAALFVFEHLSLPLPQSDMSIPAPYEIIAAEPGQFTLLDIPLAWRNGFRITGPLHPGFMFGQFYQTGHQQRLLQGNTSRNPEFLFQYFTEAPVINSILALETGHSLPPSRWEADRAIAGDVLRFFDIRYIVVRPGPGDDAGVTPEATLPYIETVMPVEPVYRDLTLTLYRVTLPPPPDQVEVSPAAPLARLYFGEGWGALVDEHMDGTGGLIWAQRRQARLFVPLAGKAQTVMLRLFVPGAGQSLEVSAGDWSSAPLSLSPGWGEYRLDLPTEAVRPGLNQVYLHFDQIYTVASLAQTDEAPALLVCSAGEEVGDFAHIYVNGLDVSPDQRGYNLAVISPQGDVTAASFDTHLDPAASGALARFIAAVPQGYTVAVAAADEASMNLGEDAVVALRSIGATGDLRGRFRWSHAVIGFKGAEPGSALEALDGLRPVSVALGPPVTEPGVAAAVAWIRFEASK